MIKVRDLTVRFDDFTAVDHVSIDVGPGEVCGLIGPNGAGKTTTMRAMIGLIEPTAGTVELNGYDVIEHSREAMRKTGFMPDFPPMYDDLRVWEFLDLFAASYDVPKAERFDAVDRHLELVGLLEKRHSGIVELSRGMRQRLMLAKSLIADPDILLLDEPASGMDPWGRINLKMVLKELAARGKAVLISSHILSEMSEFCTSVAIMECGRLVVAGAIDEVKARVMGAGVELVVEVIGDASALADVVADDPMAGLLMRRDGAYVIPYAGTPEQSADLLGAIVGAGVRVAAFGRRKEGLEELFLKVGARELS